jgi:phosphoglycerol transferase MdoB-like AlkP superfamily enzyme
MVARLVRFLGWNVLLLVLVFTGMRIAFWSTFQNPADASGTSDLFEAFYLGLKFDLRLALLLNLPLAVLGALPPLDPFRVARARRFWLAYYAFFSVLLLLTYAVDFGHYGYLEARVDASVLRYLFDPRESAGVVWGSYPVIRGVAAIALAVVSYVLLLRRSLAREGGPSPLRPLRTRIALGVALAALYALGIYGKLSYYPLRWSDAFFSTHSFSSALSLNPVLYFFETFDHRDVEFDAEALRQHYPAVAGYLGVSDPDAERLDFTRPAGAAAGSDRPLNVVILLLESFAYYKTGSSGNPLDATPHFDEIAREGALFRRFYTPHSGTNEIAAYYELAPLILARLTGETSAARLCLVYARYILPAALAARLGLNALAYRLYVAMLDELAGELAPEHKRRESESRAWSLHQKDGRGRPRPS